MNCDELIELNVISSYLRLSIYSMMVFMENLIRVKWRLSDWNWLKVKSGFTSTGCAVLWRISNYFLRLTRYTAFYLNTTGTCFLRLLLFSCVSWIATFAKIDKICPKHVKILKLILSTLRIHNLAEECSGELACLPNSCWCCK